MRLKNTKGLVCAFLLAFSIQGTALAEDVYEDMSLEELLNIKVKTGSFLELSLEKSPLSMTLVSREQIQQSGARHLGELLEIYVPGFQYMFNKWNGDLWGMRGIAVDRNTKIIFLVNGLKLNHESRDGAYSEMNLGLLEDIERVEVIRGPAGLVYGSGAIAGVVNVVTRKPEKTTGDMSFSYGSWNSSSLQALAHAQVNENESLTFSFGTRRSDGIGLRNSRIFGEESWPSDGDVAPAGQPSDGSAWSTPGNFRVGLDWNWNNFRLYSRFTRQRHTAGPFFMVDLWPEVVGNPTAEDGNKTLEGKTVTPSDPLALTESYSNNRRHHVVDGLSLDATYVHNIDDDELKFEAAFMGATNRIQTDFRESYQIPGVDPKAGFIDQTIGERRYFLETQYLLKRFENINSAFGIEFRVDDIGKDLEGMNMHGGIAKHLNVSNVVYNNIAFYTENMYELETGFGDFNFIGGLRFDKHTRTDGIFSPKLAVVYSPNTEHSIKAIFQGSANNGSADNYEYNWRHYNDQGEIIREAHIENPNDKSSTKIPAVTEEQLHSLKPETILSYELASTHKFGNNLTLAPSVSYNTVDNLFVWNQSLFRVINGPRFNFLNAEADLNYQISGFSLGLSHAFQKPVNTVSNVQTFDVPATNVVEVPGEPVTYKLEPIAGQTEKIEVDAIKDQITRDGSNFINLASNISKLYLTYNPDFEFLNFLTLHTNLRVFWGLNGRSDLYADGIAKGENYLGITTVPMVKWNASVQFALPMQFKLSAYAYDILGQNDNLHGVRWQQSAFPDQKDLYTVDQRSFAIQLERQF